MAWLYPKVSRERLAATLGQLHGRRCAVMGLGVTGQAVARLLGGRGAHLLLADERPLDENKQAALAGLTYALAPLPLGADAFAGCELVIVSPGVPPFHAALEGARARGVMVAGEFELVRMLAPDVALAAITGTNGKSTTTALLGAWLTGLGIDNFCGGNLGVPPSAYLADPNRPACAVLEVSSYQIDGAHHFAPSAAAVLNLAPDHLARYGTLEAYAQSKARLVHAVPETGYVVLNADDPHTRAMAAGCQGRVLYFGSTAREVGEAGLHIEGDEAVAFGNLPWGDGQAERFALTHPRLFGPHNRQNAAAALLLLGALRPELLASGVPRAPLLAAYRAFAGLPHRLAYVAEVRGVTFINDSKATNDAAAAIGIAGVDRPLVVLLGGQDKGGGYAEVRRALLAARVRAVVCFGAARAQLDAALGDLRERYAYFAAASLEDALRVAVDNAQPGDAVLLSPACASFDAFASYIARGEAFARWVQRHALGPEAGKNV